MVESFFETEADSIKIQPLLPKVPTPATIEVSQKVADVLSDPDRSRVVGILTLLVAEESRLPQGPASRDIRRRWSAEAIIRIADGLRYGGRPSDKVKLAKNIQNTLKGKFQFSQGELDALLPNFMKELLRQK